MESILTSVKKICGIEEQYTHFDPDIVMYINSVLAALTQIGVGPAEGFRISDKTATWDQFIPVDCNLETVKSYVGIKVRLMFDPPLSSTALESMNRMASELEWRISVEVDCGVKKEEVKQ